MGTYETPWFFPQVNDIRFKVQQDVFKPGVIMQIKQGGAHGRPPDIADDIAGLGIGQESDGPPIAVVLPAVRDEDF